MKVFIVAAACGLSAGLTPCDSVETSSTFSNENSSISSEEENTSSEEPVHVLELASVIIPATGHTPEHVEYKAPTCAKGNIEYWIALHAGSTFRMKTQMPRSLWQTRFFRNG